MDRLRVAWFSLFPEDVPASVSAYASSVLIPQLEREFDLTLFSRRAGDFNGRPVSHYLSAFRHHQENPFDICFYHFEDRREADFVRLHLGLLPGVIWFHDFFLTSDGPEPILNSSWEDTVSRFHDASVSWPAHDKEYTRERPLAHREAGLAQLCLFSNPRDHAEFRRLVNHGLSINADRSRRSFYLPHPVRSAVFEAAQPRATAVAFCGSTRVETRPHKLLGAVSKLHTPRKLLWFLTEGSVSEAEAMLREYAIRDAEIIRATTVTQWAEVVSHAGVAVHSRFSVFGQPSPYLFISLAAGVPVITTNFGAAEGLPEGVVIKVAAGETEATEMQLALDSIDTPRGNAIGKAGRDFARDVCDERDVAQNLSAVLRQELPLLRLQRERWESLERAARSELLREAVALSQGEVRNPVLDIPVRDMYSAQFRQMGWLA